MFHAWTWAGGLSTKKGGSFSAGSACRAEELRFFLAAKTALLHVFEI